MGVSVILAAEALALLAMYCCAANRRREPSPRLNGKAGLDSGVLR